MKSSKKLTEEGRTTHVFDTCVWVTLANHIRHRSLAHHLLRRSRVGELHFACPEVVRDEFNAGIGKQVQRARSEATQAADTLAWLVDAAIRDVWWFAPGGPRITESHRDSLAEVLSAIGTMESDPLEVDVKRAIEKDFEPIPCLRADIPLVGKHAVEGKAPFISKGASVADARILFATLRFARKHSARDFHFYTLNCEDFGDPDNPEAPHPDIAALLDAAPNVTYHGRIADVYELRQDEALLEASEQAFQDELVESQWRSDACQRCQGEVGFESVFCVSCGRSVDCPPSPDECSLRPYRSGYLIDLHHDGSRYAHRLMCEHCARKTFDIEYCSYCDYCEHMMGKA